MKTRWKILIAISLAVLVSYIVQYSTNARVRGGSPVDTLANSPSDLYNWYQYYNEAYFRSRLPHEVVIDWSESDPLYMASTVKMTDGKFHISFNPRYCRAERVAHTTLLHELCHIDTDAERDLMSKDHGPQWRTCMLSLDSQGAWRHELIDGYMGQ